MVIGVVGASYEFSSTLSDEFQPATDLREVPCLDSGQRVVKKVVVIGDEPVGAGVHFILDAGD